MMQPYSLFILKKEITTTRDQTLRFIARRFEKWEDVASRMNARRTFVIYRLYRYYTFSSPEDADREHDSWSVFPLLQDSGKTRSIFFLYSIEASNIFNTQLHHRVKRSLGVFWVETKWESFAFHYFSIHNLCFASCLFHFSPFYISDTFYFRIFTSRAGNKSDVRRCKTKKCSSERVEENIGHGEGSTDSALVFRLLTPHNAFFTFDHSLYKLFSHILIVFSSLFGVFLDSFLPPFL